MPDSKRVFSILASFKPPAGPATWQGNSVATWEAAGGGRGRGGPPAGGSLKVVTTGARPGDLRKNGYPYSDKTTVTEYYDRTNESNGDSWIIITTIVNDPVYLGQEFITSTHFKKQADEKGWNPQPCNRQIGSHMSMITLKVNGRSVTVDADPATPLLYVLSDDLALRGPKFGMWSRSVRQLHGHI
jgi:hypothetical protein